MEKTILNTRNNAAFDLKYHLVLVTKYRRRALTPTMLSEFSVLARTLLAQWRCELIESGGEEDHVHLLFAAHPAMDLSSLVNNLKTVTSRILRRDHAEHLAEFYWKPVLWHSAYYIGSVGGATLETVRNYVENQGLGRWPKPE